MTKRLSPDEEKYIDLTTRYTVLKSLKKNTGSLHREILTQRKRIDPKFADRVDHIQKEAKPILKGTRC